MSKDEMPSSKIMWLVIWASVALTVVLLAVYMLSTDTRQAVAKDIDYLLRPTASLAIAEPKQVVLAFDPASSYQSTCAACHATGVANAPILGEADQWAPRLANGLDTVVASATQGKGAMPAKGGLMSASDDQFRQIVVWMLNESGQSVE